MARLIDADKVKRAFIGNRYGTKAIEYVIDDAPTVKAIPVEWMINKLIKADNIGMGIDDWSIKDCYALVLDEWEKENE